MPIKETLVTKIREKRVIHSPYRKQKHIEGSSCNPMPVEEREF